jgi:hypothetical protein
MAQQIWAPEEGDSVAMQDGSEGTVSDVDTFEWQGGSDWQVTLTVPPDEEDDEGEEETREEQLIRYDETARGWKEV